VVGHPLAEAFPNASPADPTASGLADLRSSLEAALRTGTAQHMPRQRYDLQRPDGEWEARYWDAVNIPVPGPDGGVQCLLHQTEDVTARVHGEQAAARAERRAEGILERVADAHCTLDREFRIVSVNAAAERALGLTRDTMVGRTHWEVFPASVDTDAGRAYRHVVAEGGEQHVTQHYVGEGYDRHLEIDAYPTDEGGVAVFWRDVTERVRAEAGLKASEERLRLAVAATGLGVFDWDLVTDRVTVNARFREMLGLPDGDVVIGAAMLGGVVHPEDRALVEAKLAEAFDPRSSGSYRFEHRAVTPAGELWLLTFGQVLFAGEGDGRRAVRVIGNDLDVTERKHAEAEREHAHQQLQQQAAELELQAGELQATAAHLEEQVRAAERARTAAATSEARYRSLFSSIDEGFCVVEILFDGDGPVDYRFVEANPSFAEQTGLANAVGRTARELVPGLEQHWIDTYGRVATTGESTRFQMGSDVMGRWFDVFAFRTGAPEERRVALLFTDVSAAKAAEHERARLGRELAMERERLAYVFQQAPSFLAVLRGPDHVFALVNEAYYQLVGHRDILGRPAFDALPEVRDQGFRELLDGVLATGEPFIGREMPLLVQRTPGAAPEERYVDLAYMPLVEAQDGGDADAPPPAGPGARGPRGHRVTGVIAHGSDVTAQVLARREVERLLAEAEAARREADTANQAKSGFLATMSHEFRTPVNAVIGYAQLLDLELAGPLTEQQRAYLERLARSSQHLLGLVDDVLDLSKIEAGETRVARTEAATGPAVGAALDVVAPAAAQRGVRLVDGRSGPAGVAFVGDEDRVRQIAVNLLSNAVKFTAPGGTVTVTCETVRAAAPAASHLRGEGPWALVRVGDTGVGIAPEDQGRIFEPFHQVEGGHTRTAGGTGLGLAISRRLARLMGGDLSVESAPGVGSTFTLWLPAARREAGQWDETAPERSARAERDLTRLEAPGLGEVGGLLHEAVTEIIGAYTDRLRADPAIPRGAAMTRIQLEDHAISFLADLAQSLVIVGDAGPEAVELLKDGSAIQRAIAEAHGARRHAQGWDEAALRRDQQIFREEVERVVRAGLKPASVAVDAAVRILLGLIDRGQGLAVRAWRRAVQDTTA
jgi:PAS domain S-box-containing protein